MADETLLPFQPPVLAPIDSSVRHRFLDGISTDLEQLIGRQVTDPLAIAAEVAGAVRT